ncbi:MAG TPA: FAD/NAD(P)-binding oxidoreductase [Bryobacteraceae bacterium]|nr:FAD/NAD(P)-binding oxidoreductase [Bryobacteraceae bacterium]
MGSERGRKIVVVGAGPAGIAAACAAAEAGCAVVLMDDNPTAGGQIWRGGGGREAAQWTARLEASGARCWYGACVVSAAGGTVVAERDGEPMRIEYHELILATGARELFLPFPGWTLPGITGLGGLQALARGGVPVRGKRVVLCGSGPLLLAVAAHLREHGARVEAMAEQADFGRLVRFAARLVRWPGKLAQGLGLQWALRSVPFLTGAWPVAAEGRGELESVLLRTVQGTRRIACDWLGCAFGLIPNAELAAFLGCRIEAGVVAVDEWQRTNVAHVFCAGEPTGIGGLERSLAEGQIAGWAAAGQETKARALFGRRADLHRFSAELAEAFELRQELKELASADTIVCRCEDVRRRELAGYGGWRGAKLQTRCGMGPCQGRICGPACSFLFGWDTLSGRVRPPVFPASMGTVAAAGERQRREARV